MFVNFFRFLQWFCFPYLCMFTLFSLSNCLSVYLPVCLFFLSVYSQICLFVSLSIHKSVYLSLYLFTNLSICLSVYLSLSLFVSLSICRSVYSQICLFVSLSIHKPVVVGRGRYSGWPLGRMGQRERKRLSNWGEKSAAQCVS